MINLWTSSNPRHNLVFSELNYSTQLTIDNDDRDSEAAYMIDLFNWLWNKGYAASLSPVCLLWFSTNDFNSGGHIQYLGIYTASGADKFTTSTYATQFGPGIYCPNFPNINGQDPSFAVDFEQSSTGACYAG
jgi:hypothetical protein